MRAGFIHTEGMAGWVMRLHVQQSTYVIVFAVETSCWKHQADNLLSELLQLSNSSCTYNTNEYQTTTNKMYVLRDVIIACFQSLLCTLSLGGQMYPRMVQICGGHYAH